MKKILSLLLLSFLLCTLSAFSQTDSSQTKVFILEIRDEIDARMSRYIKLGLEEATKQEADHILIDMNTYGGGVQNADEIVSALLAEATPISVFINQNAGSAGSFISIACDSIYMAPGSSIGASTVVNQEGEVVAEKYQSFMRTKMRATAETNHRDPEIAEGMVGRYLQTDSAFVISYTADEAIANNYCEGKVKSIEEALEHGGVTNYSLERFDVGLTEKMIAIFLNPAVKSILVLLILGGLYFELQSPGIGFPLIIASLALTAYFIPDYLHGLLSYKELILFFVGIVLIVLEVFVIPGFGVAGIAGIILTFGALVLSMVKNDGFDFTYVPSGQLLSAFSVMLVGLIGSLVFLFVGGSALASSSYFKKIALSASIDKKATELGNTEESYVGKTGIAFTILRPSGKVMVENQLLDATSHGEFIDKGEKVEIVKQERIALIVRKVIS
ncbi:MAG: nodulation protein NfeD [Cyclobacteriaceae bacterium]